MKKFLLILSLILLFNMCFSTIIEDSNSNDELKILENSYDSIDFGDENEGKYLAQEFFENFEDNKYMNKETPAYKKYDFYVFTVSWSDTFCRTQHQPAKCYEKLKQLKLKRTFRIHGLWPSKKSGEFLKDCNTGKYIKIPSSYEEPFLTMSEIWPSLNSKGEKNFWTHEYNKHGYCYTKRNNIASYIPYFEKGVNLYNQLNIGNLMKESFGANPGDSFSLTYNEIEQKFSKVLGGVFFELDCYKKGDEQLLNEVRMYLDIEFKRLIGFKQRSDCDKNRKINFYIEYDN